MTYDAATLKTFLDGLFAWVEGRTSNPAVLMALRFVNAGADEFVPDLLAELSALGVASLSDAPAAIIGVVFDFLSARYPGASLALGVVRALLLKQSPGLLASLFAYLSSLAGPAVMAAGADSREVDEEIIQPVMRGRSARINPVPVA